MTIVSIHEPIRVLAAFAQGEVVPKRFKWQQRTYVIERINGQWVNRRDEGLAWHFSVQVGEETYFIRFMQPEMQWWLEEAMAARDETANQE